MRIGTGGGVARRAGSRVAGTVGRGLVERMVECRAQSKGMSKGEQMSSDRVTVHDVAYMEHASRVAIRD